MTPIPCRYPQPGNWGSNDTMLDGEIVGFAATSHNTFAIIRQTSRHNLIQVKLDLVIVEPL